MLTIERAPTLGDATMTVDEAVIEARSAAAQAKRAIWISIAVSAVLWALEYKFMGGWVKEMRQYRDEIAVKKKKKGKRRRG